MGVYVKEILNLKSMENAKVIAGEKGLSRNVKKISVIECPESPELFSGGDLYLTAFYLYKNDKDGQLGLIKQLHKSNCAGLIVINLYLKNLDSQIINYADKVDFPLILIHHTIQYSEIISEVMGLIIDDKERKITNMYISQLMNLNYESNKAREIAYSLNTEFYNKGIVIFYKGNMNFKDIQGLIEGYLVKEDYVWEVMKFHETKIIILTFAQSFSLNIIYELVEKVNKKIMERSNNFSIGYSNLFKNLTYLGLTFNQARIALEIVSKLDLKISSYKNLGIYKILYKYHKEQEFVNHYQNYLKPIKQYDIQNNSELFKTAIKYVENEGLIKETSYSLSVHPNTVRYRINKMQEILNLNSSICNFYEKISIAVKIYKIRS